MATSSITHNFVISNPNSVKLFIAAIDEADRDLHPVCRDGHFARIHSGGGELAYSGAGRDGRDHQYRRRRHDACRLARRQIWRVF